MGFSAAYVLPDQPPAEGDHVASITGYSHWTNYVLAHAAEYPEAAHLAAWGWADRFDDLEAELESLLHAGDDSDLSAITAQVLAAVRARPDGATEFMVTDGEPGDEEEPPG